MSAAPSGASSWLRSQTRGEHAAAEAALDLDRLRGPGGLAALLCGWAQIWHDVRDAASAPTACARAARELVVPAAESLSWLRQDLADLTDAAGLADPADLADLADPADPTDLADGAAQGVADLLGTPAGAWGMAYVLRGSRLGGRVLAPQVAAAVALPAGCATAFLASAGTDTGADWVAFRRRLDSAALTPADLDVAVAAARWTFRWVGRTISVVQPV